MITIQAATILALWLVDILVYVSADSSLTGPTKLKNGFLILFLWPSRLHEDIKKQFLELFLFYYDSSKKAWVWNEMSMSLALV